MKPPFSAVASLAVLLLCAASALYATDWAAEPRYGTISLSAGFSPDPYSMAIQAGGTAPAETVASGCAGFIDAEKPDLDLNYTTGEFQLFISAVASVDVTLVIFGPDGDWYCNDDYSAETTDASIAFPDAPTGNYNIWVGTFTDPGSVHQAQIVISESGPGL